MKTRPAGSPTIGSREISTRVTLMLSSAQPVTAIAPTTPVVLVSGVSKLPNGWVGVALDNIEVTRVDISREPIVGEPAGLVFMGTAGFVAGARPDRENRS